MFLPLPFFTKPIINIYSICAMLQSILPTSLSKDHLAMLLMVIGCMSFAGGFIYANQQKLHPITTGLARGISVTIACIALARYNIMDIGFPSPYKFKWLLIRNSIMVLQGLVYAGAQFYLPLPIAITLNSISPIFVCIYDYFLYGVTINRRQLAFLFVSIIGVCLTANGSYLISFFDENFAYDSSKFQNYQSKDPVVMVQAGLIVVIMMMGHSYGVVITKKLMGVHTIQINLVQGLMILLTSAVLTPIAYDSQGYHIPDLWMFLKTMVYCGVPMAIGQLAYIGALTMTKNLGVLTTLSFTSIILGYLISVLRYGEPINMVCTLGAISIIVGIIFIVRCKDPIEAK